MEKVSILVDVQNVYYTTRQAFDRQFDYRAFWGVATANRAVVSATAYAIQPSSGKQASFQQILREIGFEVKLKPYITRRDGSAKADWDVGIALDMMDLGAACDTIVLASGDGDFDMAIDRVRKRHHVNTEVFGVQMLTAASLIQASDHFIPIDERFMI
jgi:uncharacterized LabA/DUF88 family protein